MKEQKRFIETISESIAKYFLDKAKTDEKYKRIIQRIVENKGFSQTKGNTT